MSINLTEEQKQQTLKHIARVPVEDLIRYLKARQITFQEMKETGKLSREKQDQIKKVFDQEAAKRKQEEEYWQQVQTKRTISAFQNYLRKFPKGKFTEAANDAIETLQEELVEKKVQTLEEIKHNPKNFSAEGIRGLINSGVITKQDLITHKIITESALRLYLNPPDFYMPQNEWKDLPALPKGRTDVFFFGIPGSGKSCVLGGMFLEANNSKEVTLKKENTNVVGRKYMDELIKTIKVQYVPKSTTNAGDTVNYIPFSLIDKARNRDHPYSIIEMSGEYFKSTYLDSGNYSNGISESNSINVKGYLYNENRKVIFLVIDYRQSQNEYESYDTTAQEDILQYCLDKMEEDRIMRYTDSIQVIVTKSDLMATDDKMAFTQDFLANKYGNLIDNIKRINKQYNINANRKNKVIFHPFSLGRFMLEKTFIYDPRDSVKLLNSLLNSSAHRREKGIISKLLGS